MTSNTAASAACRPTLAEAERTGYRDLAPGLRIDGDADLPVTVFPLQGRWRHVWLAGGLLALAMTAAALSPWWVLGMLRTR